MISSLKDLHGRHRRFFGIAGVTVCIESDLDLGTIHFNPELISFETDGPGNDNVVLHHCFKLPDLKDQDLGKEIYSRPPWIVSRRGDTWFYLNFSTEKRDAELLSVAVFNAQHSYGRIYNPPEDEADIREHGWHSLSLFPTDQVWLAPLLADRHAVMLHSAGVILNGKGLLFVGHSGAGKSTTTGMLKRAFASGSRLQPSSFEVLCDDRNIARRWADGWRIHGTWSHGDVSDVSSSSAPLSAILFLQQDVRNEILPITDRKAIWKQLLATLIKGVVTAEWWEKELSALERMVEEIPCYMLHLDKSDAILAKLMSL